VNQIPKTQFLLCNFIIGIWGNLHIIKNIRKEKKMNKFFNLSLVAIFALLISTSSSYAQCPTPPDCPSVPYQSASKVVQIGACAVTVNYCF